MVSPDQSIAVTMSSAAGWPASVPSVRQAVWVRLVVSSSVYHSSSGRQFMSVRQSGKFVLSSVRLSISVSLVVSSSVCIGWSGRQLVSLYQFVLSVVSSSVYISSSCQSSVRQSISVSLVVTIRQSGCISSSCPQFVSLCQFVLSSVRQSMSVRLVLSSSVSVYWLVRLVFSSSACISSVLSSVLSSVSVRLVVSLWKPLAASFYLHFFSFFLLLSFLLCTWLQLSRFERFLFLCRVAVLFLDPVVAPRAGGVVGGSGALNHPVL